MSYDYFRVFLFTSIIYVNKKMIYYTHYVTIIYDYVAIIAIFFFANVKTIILHYCIISKRRLSYSSCTFGTTRGN
jgi:hypothetical protein